ncbi:MAG: putative quinol monooxygenase [Pyrinomonadaceae bacterium]
MKIGRREFVVTSGTAAAYALSTSFKVHGESKMYGLIGKMLAAEGKRDELIRILLEGTDKMPGCLSYVIAKDPSNKDAVWITEVWKDKESHAASLKLESVKSAIARARPIIGGFGERFETEPVGGSGLT